MCTGHTKRFTIFHVCVREGEKNVSVEAVLLSAGQLGLYKNKNKSSTVLYYASWFVYVT